MTGKLNGKVAIITGASSGLGEATAIALAAEGAKVALVARRGDRLEALAAKIVAAGGEALAIVADVTNDAQIQTLVDRTKTTWGQIDILVNSKGVVELSGRLCLAVLDIADLTVNAHLYAGPAGLHRAEVLIRLTGDEWRIRVHHCRSEVQDASYRHRVLEC